MRSMVEGYVQSGVAYGPLCPSTTPVGAPPFPSPTPSCAIVGHAARR